MSNELKVIKMYSDMLGGDMWYIAKVNESKSGADYLGPFRTKDDASDELIKLEAN